MKNLIIISLLLLSFSSCIKVQDGAIECAPVQKPDLGYVTQPVYTTAIGQLLEISIDNYSSNNVYYILSPDGDSTRYSTSSSYPFEIYISSVADTGTYFIYSMDRAYKCTSEKVPFRVKTAINPCNLTANRYTVTSGTVSAYSSYADSYTYYYRVTWNTSVGSMYINFGTRPSTTTQTYTISQVSGSSLDDYQCSMQHSASSNYYATEGTVEVQYYNGVYNVQFCDATWRDSNSNYYYDKKGWLQYSL